MVKGLDSYEEKEDEVIKEVGGKASERLCPVTLSPSKRSLSHRWQLRSVRWNRVGRKWSDLS